MKKFLFSLLAALLLNVSADAADTTRVRSHDKVVIKTNPSKGFTEYPARVGFPADSVSYRKIYMYLEFGCAPGLRCGEWDYLNYIYLEKDSQRYEISRFITPYGFYWNSGMNWKHGWYFDLTDFAYLFSDSVDIVYRHTGYEANHDRGWTVTMDFHLVHGTPARIPVGSEELYRQSAQYGNKNNPFPNIIQPKNFTMPPGSDMVNFKTIQTGHGMDSQQNCAEFCSKKRTILLDGKTISEEQVWRNNCGQNSLFPQAGTWIYDRAGWCPGASVIPSDVFQMLAENTPHTLALNMEDYTNNFKGSIANYAITTHAQYFKDNRKQYDAAVDDILSPSTHYEYLRMNPVCGAPVVRVKNLGTDTIRTVEFEYGVEGAKMQTIWVPCNIAPFRTQDLTLEAVWDWKGTGNNFRVTITKVNDHADEYTDDNTMYSVFQNSPTFPNRIIILFKSNSAPSENYYTLHDSRGKLIYSRNNFNANTVYRDTVQLDNNVCYTFRFADDGPPNPNYQLNKDGLDWWGNPADGSGYIQIRSGINNSMLKNFNADFGTEHVLNFHSTFAVGLHSVAQTPELDVFPNPGSGVFQVSLHGTSGRHSIAVFDAGGRQVYETEGDQDRTFETGRFAPGIYWLRFEQGDVVLIRKLVVAE